MLPSQEPGDYRALFPCGLEQYLEPASFRPPFSGLKPGAEEVAYYRDKAENNPHMQFEGGVVRWLIGVQIPNIAKALAVDPPTANKLGCDR